MNKLLIATTALLVGCSQPQIIGTDLTDEKPDGMCIAGYVETSPGKGTLDIYYPSSSTTYEPGIQSIKDVSIEVAEEITAELGVC